MYEPFPYFVLSLFPEKNSQTLPAVNSAEFTVMETQLMGFRKANVGRLSDRNLML